MKIIQNNYPATPTLPSSQKDRQQVAILYDKRIGYISMPGKPLYIDE